MKKITAILMGFILLFILIGCDNQLRSANKTDEFIKEVLPMYENTLLDAGIYFSQMGKNFEKSELNGESWYTVHIKFDQLNNYLARDYLYSLQADKQGYITVACLIEGYTVTNMELAMKELNLNTREDVYLAILGLSYLHKTKVYGQPNSSFKEGNLEHYVWNLRQGYTFKIMFDKANCTIFYYIFAPGEY